jgi:aminoglycoside 3-N-acetyltransferase
MDARVLMIEVGYWAFTGFHLAEYRYTALPPRQRYACVVPEEGGGRHWAEFEDVVLDDQKFEDIGRSMEKEVAVRRGKVGRAQCRLVPLAAAVEFAAEWMAKDRAITPG